MTQRRELLFSFSAEKTPRLPELGAKRLQLRRRCSAENAPETALPVHMALA